jgi:hypothetical protein
MEWLTNARDLDLRTGISVLYFYAPWVIFHPKVRDVLLDAEDKHPEVKFYGVDVDAFPQLLKRYHPACLPTVRLFKEQGKHLWTLSGFEQSIRIPKILDDIEGTTGAKL